MNWWLALFGEVAGSHGFGCFTASQPPTSVKECVKKWCALIQPIMRRGMWGPLSISSVRPPRTREPYPIILWFSHFWHEALSHLDQTQFSLMAPANRPSPSRPPATRPASSSADELVSLQRPSHALMNGRVEKSRRSSRAKLKASQERLLGAALSQGAGTTVVPHRARYLGQYGKLTRVQDTRHQAPALPTCECRNEKPRRHRRGPLTHHPDKRARERAIGSGKREAGVASTNILMVGSLGLMNVMMDIEGICSGPGSFMFRLQRWLRPFGIRRCGTALLLSLQLDSRYGSVATLSSDCIVPFCSDGVVVAAFAAFSEIQCRITVAAARPYSWARGIRPGVTIKIAPG
ncbi:hypothetical protein B0T24DRAFT_124602 [Lasiosphaeria ovina]|uniref:Uncharacterized protein n=1 Tax=Lasiosphaeria ovina TaxID=92902 RepID=A0AAE0MY52_9PEZI|nr:hypothetical protein B0T24DRAFT_124602 [Lasiosphaeria ovina]